MTPPFISLSKTVISVILHFCILLAIASHSEKWYVKSLTISIDVEKCFRLVTCNIISETNIFMVYLWEKVVHNSLLITTRMKQPNIKKKKMKKKNGNVSTILRVCYALCVNIDVDKYLWNVIHWTGVYEEVSFVLNASPVISHSNKSLICLKEIISTKYSRKETIGRGIRAYSFKIPLISIKCLAFPKRIQFTPFFVSNF